jgi:GAF domain-containing protein
MRHKVHSPAYVTKDENSSFILPHLNEIVDIGEDGMCFQNSSPLEPKENFKVCLDLSETRTHIEADGEIIWSSDSGRTGVRFQKISKESLQQLKQWLFINNIIACANHSSSIHQVEDESSAANESLEYNGSLLPDHTSALAAVAAISREVAALGTDIDVALQLISDRALGLTRATGSAIALAGNENMICRASSGSDAPPVDAMLQIGSGFSGECVRSGQLLHCDDAETDSRVDQQSCKALGVRSMIAAPVRLDGAVSGLLEVFSPQPHVFTDSDKDILQRLAEIVSQTIRRSALPSENAVNASMGPELSEEEESGGSSRRTRLLLALAAAVVATLLALVVIPRVRSKMADSNPALQSGVATNHTVQTTVTPESLEALRHLADQGDATAQFALGIRYAEGDRVKQDYTEAAHWFALAADQGEVKAQSVLAAYYWNGTGVPKDLTKAYFWAILARANGDEASTTRAAELETRISYSERNAARQQADDWLREHGPDTASGLPR